MIGKKPRVTFGSIDISKLHGPGGLISRMPSIKSHLTSFAHLTKSISPMMSMAFCFSSIGVAGNIITYLRFGLITGGPVVIFWGWMIISTLTFFSGKIIKIRFSISRNLFGISYGRISLFLDRKSS